MKTIKEMVKGKKVHFNFYRGGVLYYETDDGFIFEVPASDTGMAKMLRDDKAILFMRWIRRQVEANEANMRDG